MPPASSAYSFFPGLFPSPGGAYANAALSEGEAAAAAEAAIAEAQARAEAQRRAAAEAQAAAAAAAAAAIAEAQARQAGGQPSQVPPRRLPSLPSEWSYVDPSAPISTAPPLISTAPQAYGSDGTPYTGIPGGPHPGIPRSGPRRHGGVRFPQRRRGAYNADPIRPPVSMGDDIRMGVPRIGEDPYLDYDPDLFDEHDGDGRGLDNEIIGAGFTEIEDDDDSPRMIFPGEEQGNLSEIVGDLALVGMEQDAILATLMQARDNRRPCPPMVAVDLDAPLFETGDVLGCALGALPYPLTQQLLEAWRAAGKPRIVRVDSEADYGAFRAASSPERAALLSRLAKLEGKFADHLADPGAHAPDDGEDLDAIEALAAAEAEKRIPMRMPKHFDGLLEEWHDGDMAAGTMLLRHPGGRGRWAATASEGAKKGQLEAARAATEAGVPAAVIVGYLPGIGASLAAADAVKSLASGAESILARPEAQGRGSFLVRLDPQVSPAVFALAELLCLCQAGRADACAEWNALSEAAPGPIRQAMAEVQAALRPPGGRVTAVGGAVSDFFGGLWDRIRSFFSGLGGSAPAAPPPAPAPAAPPAAPRLMAPPEQRLLAMQSPPLMGPPQMRTMAMAQRGARPR